MTTLTRLCSHPTRVDTPCVHTCVHSHSLRRVHAHVHTHMLTRVRAQTHVTRTCSHTPFVHSFTHSQLSRSATHLLAPRACQQVSCLERLTDVRRCRLGLEKRSRDPPGPALGAALRGKDYRGGLLCLHWFWKGFQKVTWKWLELHPRADGVLTQSMWPWEGSWRAGSTWLRAGELRGCGGLGTARCSGSRAQATPQ